VDILERLTEGAEKVAREAEKVFEQSRRKVEGFQTERQMDATARRLGYLEYETHRGRLSDPAKREELLAELGRLEEEQKAREEARAQQQAARDAQEQQQAASGQGKDASGEMAEVRRVQEAAAAAGVAPEPVTGTARPSDLDDSTLDGAEAEERRMYSEEERDGA
jgi:hypothetical protein